MFYGQFNKPLLSNSQIRSCQYEKYPIRRRLGTQNPLQNHLQKGLEHKGLYKIHTNHHSIIFGPVQLQVPSAPKFSPPMNSLLLSVDQPSSPVKQSGVPISPLKSRVKFHTHLMVIYKPIYGETTPIWSLIRPFIGVMSPHVYHR